MHKRAEAVQERGRGPSVVVQAASVMHKRVEAARTG